MELVVAMLIAPFLFNVFSFWIIDSFLKGMDWKVTVCHDPLRKACT